MDHNPEIIPSMPTRRDGACPVSLRRKRRGEPLLYCTFSAASRYVPNFFATGFSVG
jgi:hypothetical protein